MIRAVIALAFSCVTAIPAVAVDGLAPRPGEARRVMNPGVRIDEKLGEQVPLDLKFRNENGDEVAIGDCIGGKPTILVLAYFRCPMNCTDVLNGLVDAMKAMPNDFSVGGAFNVLTVSFDEREQPELAREKRKVYLAEYGRPGAEAGWHFLTGKKEPIRQLTDAVGYRYVYDKVYKEYDHLSGIILLRPNGQVFRYFYGIGYGGEKDIRYDSESGFRIGKTTLKMSLVEASDGRVGSLLDKLAFRCFRFDHLEQKYALNVLLAVRVGGALTILLLVGGVTYFVVRDRRRLPPTPGETAATTMTEVKGSGGPDPSRPADVDRAEGMK